MLDTVFLTKKLSLFAVGLLATSFVTAQEIPPDSVLQGFEPKGSYIVVKGDTTIEDARLFEAQRAGSVILIQATQFSSPVLITPRSKKVELVPENKVVLREDGRVDILSDAEFTSQGEFTIEGGQVNFSVGGEAYRLEERPYLLGLQSTQAMVDHDSTYGYRSSHYKPSGPMVRTLAAQPAEVRVRVFFGSWCPHCQEMVPRAIAVAQKLEESNVSFEYYGLPRPFDDEPVALKANIRAVPTGVVYRDGKEIGRIEGGEWKIPELALKRLLQ